MITEMESMGEQVQLPYCKKQRFLAKGISLHGLRVTAAIAIALWVVDRRFSTLLAGDSGGVPLLTALSWIAPTLLMFITVEELRLAENKVRYVMRLLVCAVLCGLVVLGTNLFFDSRFGAYWPANFLYDLFYAAVLGLVLESLVRWNEISGKEKFIHLAMLFAVVVIVALWQRALEMLHPKLYAGVRMFRADSVTNFLWNSVFPTAHRTEYQGAFIILGALWYVFGSRKTRLWALTAYALSGFLVSSFQFVQNDWAHWLGYTLPMGILGNRIEDARQVCALLAVPFLLLYYKHNENAEISERSLPHSAPLLQTALPVASCCVYAFKRLAEIWGWI
jgi:hypothetical protein